MVSRSLLLVAALGYLATAGLSASAEPTAGYYRWPTAGRDAVIFGAQGDLWRAGPAGGPAHRLTTHPEQETDPWLSPDGKRIAFVAAYDAAREIYVMPASGGAPRQVSFEGGGVTASGWSPDGRVIYTSRAVGKPMGRIVRLVDPETLETADLPLGDANEAVFSGDGTVVFFTRFGISTRGDHVRLYRGGAMSQLWRHTIGKREEAVRLSAGFGAPIKNIMWHGGRIYFISDKSGTDNIWSMKEDGGDLVQHTKYKNWHVRMARMKDGVIAFQLGADVHIYDIAEKKTRPLELVLIADHDGRRRRWLNKPLDYLTSARFAPRGDRVALTARGRMALASPGPLRRVEFSVPGPARARSAAVGAEGKWLYAILDQGVRGEIWRYPLDGRGPAKRLTDDATARRWSVYPSPYGKYLAHDTKAAKLYIHDLDTGEDRLIEAAEGISDNPFSGFAWSPGNRYLAYARELPEGRSQIVIADLQTRRTGAVTTSKYHSYAPAFSADGKWLYFLSDRHFSPTPGAPWGDRNMGPQFDRRSKIFALALRPEARFPFQPEDELAPQKGSEDKKDGKDSEENDKEASAPEIVRDGLAERLFEVPAPPGNYRSLNANEAFLFVLDGTDEDVSLKSVKIDPVKPEMQTFAEKVRGYALSADGKKLFYALAGEGQQGQMFIVEAGAKAPGDLANARLRTDDWKIAVDPAEEWRQMFLDAWRMHRDFAFDRNLRGVDWAAVRKRFEPLVARISHRGELDDLLGEMIRAMGILHSQVGRGDRPVDDEKGEVAALGAEFAPVPQGMRVTHIYRSEAGLPGERPPLARPEVDMRKGDIVTAVNGAPVTSHAHLYRHLQHRAGQQVVLDVKRGDAPVRKAVVVPAPARSAFQFRYNDWVESRRERVAKLGKGKIGYLHMQAMGPRDVANFARDYYEHLDKDGLIIDVRGNHGGNVDSWIIGTLLRRVWAFWGFPGEKHTWGNMQQTFRGHIAVLINEGTYSDGETFAAGIKALDIAPLIGTRTAGAGIWLSDRNPLSDDGIARIAEFPQFGTDGRWLIEGRGVSPDIKVENPPYASYRGGDRQLRAAVDHLIRKIAEEPIAPLKPGPLPPVGGHGEEPQAVSARDTSRAEGPGQAGSSSSSSR